MRRGKLPFFLFFLLDAVYAVTVTVLFSVVQYALNNGRFRWFLLFAAILGMAAYLATVGRVVMFFAETIVRFLRAVFRILVIVPLCFTGRLLHRIAGWIAGKTVLRWMQWIRRRNAMRYTEKIRRKLVQEIRFTAEKSNGKGRDG